MELSVCPKNLLTTNYASQNKFGYIPLFLCIYFHSFIFSLVARKWSRLLTLRTIADPARAMRSKLAIVDGYKGRARRYLQEEQTNKESFVLLRGFLPDTARVIPVR